MWAYAGRRILYAVPIAIGVTVICFGLVFLAPGDPMVNLLPPDASPADVAYLRKLYGFDQPVPIQYAKWLLRAVTGDLGTSLQTGRPVISEVGRALSNTIVISLGAVLLAFSLAFVLGTLAGYYAGRPADRALTAVSVVGVSVPNYWLGMVLIIVFSVQLGLLPATGMGSAGSDTFSLFNWEQVKYAILQSFNRLLLLVSSVAFAAMGVSALGVTNTIMASIRSRRWQFGVLRSVGVTRGGLLRLVLAEATLLGLVGVGLGLVAGLHMAFDARQFSADIIGYKPDMVVPWPIVWIGTAIILLISFFASLGPAIGVARSEPLTLLQAGRAST